MTLEQKIKSNIRDVENFPTQGILFKDITPLLLDPQLTNEIIDTMILQLSDVKIDAVCAIESRGFLYGMVLANKLNVPFIPVRKKGKLPGETMEYTYELEYGSSTVEVHLQDVKPGWNILIHDDLLATGGTACAAAEIMLKLNAHVAAYAFIVELGFLGGKERLKTYTDKILSLTLY
ncbi:MAG: adenine phosphoribosyltransferase [Chitinophagales bacterium]